MITLGLDPSLTNFGWATYDTIMKVCPERGRIRTSPKEFENAVDRYIYIRREVGELIQRINPDKMGCEQSVFGSSQSPAMYALFMNTMEAIKRNKRDVVLWSPTQLKSLARTLVDRPPKWKMEKADMIEAAKVASKTCSKWNDNEADAFMIALFSSKWWDYHSKELKLSDLSPTEYHAFAEYKVYSRGKKAGKVAYKGIEHAQDEKYFLWSQIETEKIGVKKQTTRSRRTTKKSL